MPKKFLDIPRTNAAQLLRIFIEHCAAALPIRKRSCQSNGHGAPLIAWMHGGKKEASKIEYVLSERARFPFVNWGDGKWFLRKRIESRYEITYVQSEMLRAHLCKHYRGKHDYFNNKIPTGLVGDDFFMFEKNTLVSIDIKKMLENNGLSIEDMPLRAIIDPRVTDLILLLQLEEEIKCLKSKTENPKSRKKLWKLEASKHLAMPAE